MQIKPGRNERVKEDPKKLTDIGQIKGTGANNRRRKNLRVKPAGN